MAEPRLTVPYYVPAGRDFSQSYARIPTLTDLITDLLDQFAAADATLEIKETLNGAVLQRFDVKKNANPLATLTRTLLTADNLRSDQDRLISVEDVPLCLIQLRIGVQRRILYDTKRVEVPPLGAIEGSGRLLWLKVLPRLSQDSPYDAILARLDFVRQQILAEFPSLPALPQAMAAAQREVYDFHQQRVGMDRLAAVARRALPELGDFTPKNTRLSLLQRLLFGVSARTATSAQFIALGAAALAQLPSLALDRDQLSDRLEAIGDEEAAEAGDAYSLMMRIDLNAKAGPLDRELELLNSGFTSLSAMDVGAAVGTSGLLLVFQQGRWLPEFSYMQGQSERAPLEHQLALRGVFSYAGTAPVTEIKEAFSYGKELPVPKPQLPVYQLYKRQDPSLALVNSVLAQPEFNGSYIYGVEGQFRLGMQFPAQLLRPEVDPGEEIEFVLPNFTRFYMTPFTVNIDTLSLYSVAAPGITATLDASRYFPGARRASYTFSWSGPRLDNHATEQPRLVLPNVQDSDTGIYTMRFLDTASNYSVSFPVELEIEAQCRRCRRAYRGSKNGFGACQSHSLHPVEISERLRAQTVTVRSLLMKEFGPQRCYSEPVLTLMNELRDRDPPKQYIAYEARLQDVRCWIGLNKRPEQLLLEELEELSPRPDTLVLKAPGRGLFVQADAPAQNIIDAANGDGPRNPNLFQGISANRQNELVRLCCRSAEHTVRGCWTGRHSALTAVPDLHDWLQLKQRGSEQLNSKYATAKQHQLIVDEDAQNDDPEQMLLLEERFNAVHGGLLEPQFHFTSAEHGVPLLERILSASGTSFGADLRVLLDHVDLSKPFACWRRDELAAQRYDEREPEQLPVYRGDRKARTLTLIRLFHSLSRVAGRLQQQKELDLWLQRTEGLAVRAHLFRPPTAAVQSYITRIETRLDNAVLAAEQAGLIVADLQKLLRDAERAIVVAESTGRIAVGDASALRTPLSNFLTRLGAVERLTKHIDGLRDLKTAATRDIRHWIHANSKSSDAQWARYAKKVRNSVRDVLKVSGDRAREILDEATAANLVVEIEQLKLDVGAVDFDALIQAAIGNLARALQGYENALQKELEDYRKAWETRAPLLSQFNNVPKTAREDLILSGVVDEQEFKASREMQQIFSTPASERATLIAQTPDAEIASPIPSIQAVQDATAKLSGAGRAAARQLTTRLGRFPDALQDALSIIELMAFRVNATRATLQALAKPRDDYLNGQAIGSFTAEMQSLASKLGYVPIFDLSARNPDYPATNAEVYDVYAALRSLSLNNLRADDLPYRTLLEAVAKPELNKEKQLYKAGDELYKAYSQLSMQMLAYSGLARALTNRPDGTTLTLNPADFNTSEETLEYYAQDLAERCTLAETQADVVPLQAEFAYMDGSGRQRPKFFEDAEAVLAANRKAEAEEARRRAEEAARREEERRQKAEADQRALEERQRLAEAAEAKAKADAEEAARQAEARRREQELLEKQQQDARTEAERQQAAEAARRAKQAADDAAAEAARALEEQARLQSEEARLEQQRQAAEEARLRAEESARLAEEQAERARLDDQNAADQLAKEEEDARQAQAAADAAKQASSSEVDERFRTNAPTGVVPVERPELKRIYDSLELLAVVPGYGIPSRSPNIPLDVSNRIGVFQRALARLIQAAEDQEQLTYDDLALFFASDVPLRTLAQTDRPAYNEEVQRRLAGLNEDKSSLIDNLLDSMRVDLDQAYGRDEALQFIPVTDSPVQYTSNDSFEAALQSYLRDPDFKATFSWSSHLLSGYALEQASLDDNGEADRLQRSLCSAVALAVLTGLELITSEYADPKSSGDFAEARSVLGELASQVNAYYADNRAEAESLRGLISRYRNPITFERLVKGSDPMLDLILAQLDMFYYASQANSTGSLTGLSSALPRVQPIYRSISSALQRDQFDTRKDLAVVLFLGIHFRTPLDDIKGKLTGVGMGWPLRALAAALSFDPKILTPHRIVMPTGPGKEIGVGAQQMAAFREDDNPFDYLTSKPRTRLLVRDGPGNSNFASESPTDRLDDLAASSPYVLLELSPSLELARLIGNSKIRDGQTAQLQRDLLDGLLQLNSLPEFGAEDGKSSEAVAADVTVLLGKQFLTKWRNLVDTLNQIRPRTELARLFAATLSASTIEALVTKQLGTYAPNEQLRERISRRWIFSQQRAKFINYQKPEPGDALSPVQLGDLRLADALLALPRPAGDLVLDAAKFKSQLFSECSDLLSRMTAKFDRLVSFYLYAQMRNAAMPDKKVSVDEAVERAFQTAPGLFPDSYRALPELQSVAVSRVDLTKVDQIALSIVQPVNTELIGAPIPSPSSWNSLEDALDSLYKSEGAERTYDEVLAVLLAKHASDNRSDARELSDYNNAVEKILVPVARTALKRLADYVYESGRTGSADRVYCYIALLLTVYRAVVEEPSLQASPLVRLYLRERQSAALKASGLAKKLAVLTDYVAANAADLGMLSQELESHLFSNAEPREAGTKSYRKPGAAEVIVRKKNQWKLDTTHKFPVNLGKLRYIVTGIGPLDILAEDAAQFSDNDSLQSQVNHAELPNWVKLNRTGGDSSLLSKAGKAAVSFFTFGLVAASAPSVPNFVIASPAVLPRASNLLDQLEQACTDNKIQLVSSRHADSARFKSAVPGDLAVLLHYPGNLSEPISKELRGKLPAVSNSHPSVTISNDDESKLVAALVLLNLRNPTIEQATQQLAQFYADWNARVSERGAKAAISKRFVELSPAQKRLFKQPLSLDEDPLFVSGDSALTSFKRARHELNKEITGAIAHLDGSKPATIHTGVKNLDALLSQPVLNHPGACLPPSQRFRNEFLYYAVDATDGRTVVGWALWNTDSDAMTRVAPDFDYSINNRDPKTEALLQLIAYGARPAVGHLLLALGMLDAHYCDQKSTCFTVLSKTPGVEQSSESAVNPVVYAAAGLRETLFSLTANFRPTFDAVEPLDSLGRAKLPGDSSEIPLMISGDKVLELDTIAGLAIVPASASSTRAAEVVTRSQLLPLEIEVDSDRAPEKGDLAFRTADGKSTVLRGPAVGAAHSIPFIGAGKKKKKAAPKALDPEGQRYEDLRAELNDVPQKEIWELERSLGLLPDPPGEEDVSTFFIIVEDQGWSDLLTEAMFEIYKDADDGTAKDRTKKLTATKTALKTELEKIIGKEIEGVKSAAKWKGRFIEAMQVYLDKLRATKSEEAKKTVPLPQPSKSSKKKVPKLDKVPTPPPASPSPTPSPPPASQTPPLSPDSASPTPASDAFREDYDDRRRELNALPLTLRREFDASLGLISLEDPGDASIVSALITVDWDYLASDEYLAAFTGDDRASRIQSLRSDLVATTGSLAPFVTSDGKELDWRPNVVLAMQRYIRAYEAWKSSQSVDVRASLKANEDALIARFASLPKFPFLPLRDRPPTEVFSSGTLANWRDAQFTGQTGQMIALFLDTFKAFIPGLVYGNIRTVPDLAKLLVPLADYFAYKVAEGISALSDAPPGPVSPPLVSPPPQVDPEPSYPSDPETSSDSDLPEQQSAESSEAEEEEAEEEEAPESSEAEEEEAEEEEAPESSDRPVELLPGFEPSTDYSLGYSYLKGNPKVSYSQQLLTSPVLANPYLAYCPDIRDSTVLLNLQLAAKELNAEPRNPMIRNPAPIGSPVPVRAGIARFFASPLQ